MYIIVRRLPLTYDSYSISVSVTVADYMCCVQMGGEEYEVRVRRDDGGVDTQLLTVEQVSQTVRDLYTRSVTLGL